ncbi:MAG: tripartite tricarboxylate transporter substrate-binding protein, partial [Deltaproteobacteria bacterium]|nr:tripartite tricarboxylate transporter substrate-binding protein [Deltaproteobacteria bacterium]
MMIKHATTAAAMTWVLLLIGLSHPPAVQSAGDFFSGKTITLIVGSSAGGGTDNASRLIARHIDKHIPGKPSVVVSNMAGAGGMRAANHLYNRVDPDGLTWSTMNTGALYGAATGNTALKFELQKFIFLGQAYDEAQMLYLRSATPYTSFEAIKKANKEGKKPKLGAQAKAHSSNVVVKIIGEILDVDFDVVYGYPGTPEILLDIERGALDGRSQGTGSLLSTKRHWLDSGFIRILVTSKSERDDRLPEIPSISELAPAGNKQYLSGLFASQFIGRSIVLPPKVPADRVKILRDAFAATVKDKAFLNDAEKLGLEVGLIRGEQMNQDIEKTLAD